jgi:hypothetical protein
MGMFYDQLSYVDGGVKLKRNTCPHLLVRLPPV